MQMTDTIKAALITGALGVIGTVAAAFIGTHHGEQIAIIQVNSQLESEITESGNLSINSVDDLINEYKKIVNENAELNVQNKKLDENYSSLQQSYDDLKDKYASLEEENGKLLQEISDLQDLYNELKNQYNDLEEQNTLLSKENKYLRSLIHDDILPDDDRETTNSATIIETVSIFDLDTFQGKNRWHKSWTDSVLTDTYGNEYPNGYCTNHLPARQDSPSFLLDFKYSKCEGKIAWPKDDKDMKGKCWIDFYDGDTLIYSTAPITANDRPLSFEFSVKNVEKLKIVCNGDAYRAITIIYEYLNLIP